ncbi:MAG: hypothetical protein LBE67_02495 [Kocuria palustris]|nr:hypothetical protein [Kocuria palustris]
MLLASVRALRRWGGRALGSRRRRAQRLGAPLRPSSWWIGHASRISAGRPPAGCPRRSSPTPRAR